MSDAQIDRILSREEILPSSGFVSSVMDAVRREAAAPPPIPFPWKRALPFAVLGAGAFGLLAFVVIFLVSHPGSVSPSNSPSAALRWVWSPSSVQTVVNSPFGLCAIALLGAFIMVKLSLRLAGGES